MPSASTVRVFRLGQWIAFRACIAAEEGEKCGKPAKKNGKPEAKVRAVEQRAE